MNCIPWWSKKSLQTYLSTSATWVKTLAPCSSCNFLLTNRWENSLVLSAIPLVFIHHVLKNWNKNPKEELRPRVTSDPGVPAQNPREPWAVCRSLWLCPRFFFRDEMGQKNVIVSLIVRVFLVFVQVYEGVVYSGGNHGIWTLRLWFSGLKFLWQPP